MSGIDWLLLGIVAASTLLGLMRGLIGVVASLVAWVLACWVAFRFGGDVAFVLAGSGQPTIGYVLAGYALSFLVVLVVVGVVGWWIRKLVHSVGLSGLDRLLGVAAGFVRGVFVACVAVLLLGLTSMPRDPDWQTSRVVPVFVPGALWMQAWLPAWVAEQVDLGGGARVPQTNDENPASPAPLTAFGPL